MAVNQSIVVIGVFIVCSSRHGYIEAVNYIAFISELPKGSLRILCIANKIWEGDRF
jgi:hypothetical protein